MVGSLILIEGTNVKEDNLRSVSLSNAKQLVGEGYSGFGIILHITANTSADLTNAILKFGEVSGVSKVITLALNVS